MVPDLLKREFQSACQCGTPEKNEMEELFSRERPELVLDATHPYAAEVTKISEKPARKPGVSYMRILREGGGQQKLSMWKHRQRQSIWKGTTGNVLLTTGSKELAAFTSIPDYKERLFARVLSLPSVIETCRRHLGLRAGT